MRNYLFYVYENMQFTRRDFLHETTKSCFLSLFAPFFGHCQKNPPLCKSYESIGNLLSWCSRDTPVYQVGYARLKAFDLLFQVMNGFLRVTEVAISSHFFQPLG